MKTLLIMPAYNEAANITSVISEVLAQPIAVDLLVVDDGSTDRTGVFAERAGARVLRLPFNLGYGAAVQTGLLYAVERGYNECALIDGDGQHDPKHIADLLAAIEDGKADLALGSRFLGSVDYVIPLGRRIGIYLFSRIASFFTHQHITDPTSGFQAINQRLMRFFVNDNYPYDFPDADTLIRLYFAGFKIKEVPVTIRPRSKGRSMHGGGRTLYYIYKILFSILIALTQRRMLAKGGNDATDNQDSDRDREPVGNANDHQSRTSETAR